MSIHAGGATARKEYVMILRNDTYRHQYRFTTRYGFIEVLVRERTYRLSVQQAGSLMIRLVTSGWRPWPTY